MAVTGARRLIFPGECRLRHRGSERVRQLQSRRREHPGNSHVALRPRSGIDIGRQANLLTGNLNIASDTHTTVAGPR